MVGRIVKSINVYPGPGKPEFIYSSQLLENLRGAATMCSGCTRYKPKDSKNNCHIAEELVQLGFKTTIATLVSRCGFFDAKPRPQTPESD